MRWRAARTMQFIPPPERRARGGAHTHDVVPQGKEGDQVDPEDMVEDDRKGFRRMESKIRTNDTQARVVAVDFGDGRPRTCVVGKDVVAAIDSGPAGRTRTARLGTDGRADGGGRDPRRGGSG